MKRFYLLFVTFVMAVSMVAAVSVPQNFNGIRLGLSSKTEVDKILTSNGLEFSADDSDTTNIVYKGNCKHEEMDFGAVVLRFHMDTVILVGYVAKCDSACAEFGKPFIRRIHAKYEALARPDSSFYYSLLTTDADSLGLEKWGRKDDNSWIITMHNDTICMCVYFAAKRFSDMMTNALFNLFISLDPDFAEENKVYGVAGVKFGDSKETVRKVISSKANQLLESDSHSLNYYKVKIGGTTYDYATFYFTAGKGLVSVNLQSSFYSWREKEALMAFEGVKSQYSRKYTNFKVQKDEPDEKTCTCGAFIDGYDYIPIIITFQKALSRGGDIMYYIQVDYYYSRRKNLYDDEI